MSTPEKLSAWSRLTRRQRRQLQFRPESTPPTLRRKVIGFKAATRMSEYQGPNPNIPTVIVHTVYEPGDFTTRYLNTMDRELGSIDRMEEKGEKGGFKVVYREESTIPRDYFSKKYGPLSLDDLSNLPNQLSRQDLEKIFGFWVMLGIRTFFKPEERSKTVALYNLVGSFITKKDDKLRPNWRIQRIRASLLASLKYYREHFLNFSSEENVDLLIKAFPDSMHTLALIYSFETSGLSLSSIHKLFIQRGQQLVATGKLPLYEKLFHKPANILANKGIADIKNHRRLNTSWDYLFYEPELDKPTEKILESNYDLAKVADDGLGEVCQRTWQLIANWQQYHSRLARRLISSPVNIKIDEHPFISNIRLVARTKESTHFILFFKDSHLYLTLDIDAKGRLFGLPPNLAIRFPHADSVVFGDVLSTLLPKLEKMFAATAATIRQKAARKLQKEKFEAPAIQIPTPPTIGQQERPPVARTEKPPKRKALARQVLVLESQFVPEVESEVSTNQRTRLVEYTADLVRDLAGAKTPQSDLSQLMNTIRRFEFGIDKHIDTIHARELGAHGAQILRLRAGRWRIILEHSGNNVFKIMRIGDRRHVYN